MREEQNWWPGIIVEIDEMKLTRRKYNRGRQVGPRLEWEGGFFQPDLWAFGGVERLPQERQRDRKGGRCIIFIVERRDRVTLFPLIMSHILPGTTIMSDEWAAYRTIP